MLGSVPGQITLDMNGYGSDLVKRHGFADSHSAPGPGKANVILSERGCVDPSTPGAPDQTAYRSRVGGLLWLCRGALASASYHACALARAEEAREVEDRGGARELPSLAVAARGEG